MLFVAALKFGSVRFSSTRALRRNGTPGKARLVDHVLAVAHLVEAQARAAVGEAELVEEERARLGAGQLAVEKKEKFCVRTRGRKVEKSAPPVTGMSRQSFVKL